MAVVASQSAKPQSPSNVTCIDVHALHKSATMFLFKFFRELSTRYRFDFYSENNETPNGDGPPKNARENFCRCPVRTFETDQLNCPEGATRRRIFHVRDPRDILVSEYFSLAWIHPTEGSQLEQRRQSLQAMSIDQYVLQQSSLSSWPLEEKFEPLITRELNPETETVVTYEELVTDFPRWAEKVTPHFGVRFPRLVAMRLGWRYRNEFKSNSESMTHKRRITPGDHREKLQLSTIKKLNDRFEVPLKQFGYLK